MPLLSSALTLAVTLCVALVLGSVSGRPQDIDAANILVPIVVLATTLACTVAIVVRDPMAPWTPIPWFLLAAGVYFGLGALLNVFGSEDVISFAGSYFEVNRTDVLRTNVLNLTSLAIVLVFYVAIAALLGRGRAEAPVLSGAAQDRVMWIFAIVGIPSKFLLSLPYNMGLLHFVLPGVVGSLQGFSDLLLLVLCYRSVSGNARYVPWAVTFAILSFVGDVLSFSKSVILLTGLSAVLGFYLARPVRKTLFAGIFLLSLVYLASVPFVAFARNAVHGSTAVGADVHDRASVTAEYFRRPGSAFLGEDDQGWWSRINLTNIQAFAMTLHDSGTPGDTFESIAYALVPRVLWPNKPVMSPGTDFNYLASGNDQSASSPGVFAEAYWNGGWPYVIGVCAYLGGLFAWFARQARRAISARDLRWLPCAFLGVMMAFPENWFITTYVSGVVVVHGYLFVMKWLVRNDSEPALTVASGLPVAADSVRW